MHLEAVIQRVWRCTWRPRSSARLEEYLEAVNQEAVVWEGGATGAETLVIG